MNSIDEEKDFPQLLKHFYFWLASALLSRQSARQILYSSCVRGQIYVNLGAVVPELLALLHHAAFHPVETFVVLVWLGIVLFVAIDLVAESCQ